MPVLATRPQTIGGNVIDVQLDNAVGMLAWISNSPDLTDHLLVDLLRFLQERHGEQFGARYPVKWSNADGWVTAVRSPDEAWAAALRDGTDAGDAAPFPIGISQLVETHRGIPGVISGSDHYVGDMTRRTTTDLYVPNAFSDAVHDADQP